MCSKKKPTGRGAGAVGIKGNYSTADFTAVRPILIAHPACPMARTGQFEHGLSFQPMFHGAGIALMQQLVKHPVALATMPAGAENTQEHAVATPTESGVSFRPEFADAAQCRIRGYGRDGRNGNDRRTSNCVFVTSCPPNARTKVFGASKSQLGATMATANSTTTPTSGTPTSPDHHALSFVKVEHLGPRNQRLTNWFAVPDEDYCTGNATGYRVTAELMAWVQSRPSNYATGMIVREVMAAAFAVLAEPCTPHKPDRRGCAVSFLDAMAAFLMFAAQRSNHQAYLAGKAQRSEDWARESAQLDAERNRQIGQRLAAARRAKRAARMAEGEVAV